MDPKTIEVLNLRTWDKMTYVGLSPIEAVIAAHAQSRGDWNTWNYKQYRYDIECGKGIVTCGDWCTKL